MKLIKSFFACFSTYSRIPMPSVKLESDDMKYAMIFFPFVGIVIGIFEYILFSITGLFEIPVLFRTLIAIVIPVIVTGGIHIDGYMDTVDALSSYGDKEKKLSIMKDPNSGAFAIIYLAVYGITYLAFLYLLEEKDVLLFCSSFFISRIMSGISVVSITGAKQNGMLHSVKENSEKKAVLVSLIIMFAVADILLYRINILYALSVLILSIISYILYKRKVTKEFGGITGDTSGFYLCVLELFLMIVVVLEGHL